MSTENRIGLGAKLESGRRARGWSQQEASKRTKLRVDTVRRLENEEFDELPSLAYARGFIRIYARELGMDSVALLKDMDGGVEDDFDINDLRPEDLESIPRRVQPPQLTPQTIGLFAVVLVILLALTVGILALFRYGPEKSAEVARNIGELVQPLEKATPEDIEQAQKKSGVAKALPVDEAPKAEPVDTAPKAEAVAPKAEAVPAAEAAVPVAAAVPIAPAAPAAVPGEAPAPAAAAVSVGPNKLQFYAPPGTTEANRWVQVIGKRGNEDVTLFDGTIPSGKVFPGDDEPAWRADVFIVLMKETKDIKIIFNDQDYGPYTEPGSQRFLLPSR